MDDHGTNPEDVTPTCGPTEACRDALERVFEYLDGELEGATREQVEEHFRVCGNCYPALAYETSFREALQRLRRGEAAPPSTRERILAALEREGHTRPS
jgi:mycothiol system anti-sigma-R factor